MLGCSRSMLESDSSLQNTTTWWATTLSAWGCADCWMWFYMWYYIPSRPNDVKDCLILLDLMLTSSPSTAKCEPGFSATNHLKCNLWTPCQTWYKGTLQTMQWRPSDWNSALSNWFRGAKTKRHILKIFKFTTGIPTLSKNLLMFIPGTSIMLAVRTRNWIISYSLWLNCFIINTLGKLLKALSNINWQCFASQD